MRSTKILKTIGIIGSILFLLFALVMPSIAAGHIVFFAASAPVGTCLLVFTAITDQSLSDMALANDGEENMGGFGIVAYIALRSHLSTYPTPIDPTAATTLEQLCLLSGNYGFLTDKHFLKVEVAPESLFVNPVSQGDSPGTQSFNIAGGFTINGMKGKHRGMARIMNNCYGILIIPNEDGTRTAYGSENRPLQFTIKGDSGKAAKDRKKFDYEFKTDSFVPGYTYNGTIVLSGSVTLPAIS